MSKSRVSSQLECAAVCLVVVSGLASSANAGITWTGSGQVLSLTQQGGGEDVENLLGSTLTLSIAVEPGVYGDWFGIAAFAPIATGGITISGSGKPENNATHAFTFPFAAQVEPYGFSPNWETNVHDGLGFFPAITLPSGRIMTLAHGMPPTPSGAAASPGSDISIADFPVGSPGYANFTAAIHPNAVDPVVTQYESVIPTFDVTEGLDTILAIYSFLGQLTDGRPVTGLLTFALPEGIVPNEPTYIDADSADFLLGSITDGVFTKLHEGITNDVFMPSLTFGHDRSIIGAHLTNPQTTFDFSVNSPGSWTLTDNSTNVIARGSGAFTPIPEPSALIIWSLLGAFGITVGWWRRRRLR